MRTAATNTQAPLSSMKSNLVENAEPMAFSSKSDSNVWWLRTKKKVEFSVSIRCMHCVHGYKRMNGKNIVYQLIFI